MVSQEVEWTHPLVISQLSAHSEAESWERFHCFDTLLDQDGLKWSLKRNDHSEVSLDGKNMLWKSELFLEALLNEETTIETGLLSKDKDLRLIELMGNDVFKLTSKKTTIEALNEKDLNKKVELYLLNIKKKLEKLSFNPKKRSLLEEWIDKKMSFDHEFQ
jgi:hypothetical protein